MVIEFQVCHETSIEITQFHLLASTTEKINFETLKIK